MAEAKRPHCDRHTNLQMVSCSFTRQAGSGVGHVCAVPGCGRHHDREGYFDRLEAKAAQPKQKPPSRREVTRTAILKAVQDQMRLGSKPNS
jgi:hypothetical protein